MRVCTQTKDAYRFPFIQSVFLALQILRVVPARQFFQVDLTYCARLFLLDRVRERGDSRQQEVLDVIWRPCRWFELGRCPIFRLNTLQKEEAAGKHG